MYYNLLVLTISFSDYFVVVTQPPLRDGRIAEDHGAPEARQLARDCTRGRRETDSCQRAIGTKSL